jgi:hypothetical protein
MNETLCFINFSLLLKALLLLATSYYTRSTVESVETVEKHHLWSIPTFPSPKVDPSFEITSSQTVAVAKVVTTRNYHAD